MAPASKDSEPQWPPRSPHEALLSTPKGRQRYQDMLNQTSPSPSPSCSRRMNASPSRSSGGYGLGIQGPSDEEDEETLQLKLEEIQAKLRLKKLQSAKAKESSLGSSTLTGRGSDAALMSPGARTTIGSPVQHRQNPIEVPASPVRKLQAPQQQTSPSRVLLGIDKGWTAKDVSLKRAPSHKRLNSKNARQVDGAGGHSHSEEARPSSFNDRLASMRSEESFRKERQAKIQSVRSNAFGIGREEMDEYKQTAVEIPDEPLAPPVFSREDILQHTKRPVGNIPKSQTAPSASITHEASDDVFGNSSNRPATEIEETPESFEAYSCFHLSRRILPHSVITRHISGKKICTIKDLLRDVKAPDFSLPDIEQDIVVFAILAKKSEPRQRKPANGNGKKKDDDGKYMVTSLTDLDYELDMFLFDSGFKRFYKLSEGTVVAILNPSIMPPPPGKQDTGRFSLVINSDDDTILEVGMARDLGFCQSIKKDGNSCGSWVNKKKTQFCEFHSNEAVRKQQSIRVEMNTSGFGRRDSQDQRRNWRERWTSPKRKDDNENYNYNKKNNNYDWESRTQWFMSRSMSAADLIDGKDLTSGDRKERAEFLKRSLEAKEKEREMMKKLGRVGNAAGKEYMKYAGSSGQNDSASLAAASQASQDSHRVEGQPSVDAASLDLLRGDRAIHLSPVKRKRHDSSQASSVATSSRSTPYGWGGELKEKLSNMKSGENFLRGKKSTSPVRKKTRFVTSKGIREAGRESLGNELSQRQVTLEDDDDDDLVILR